MAFAELFERVSKMLNRLDRRVRNIELDLKLEEDLDELGAYDAGSDDTYLMSGIYIDTCRVTSITSGNVFLAVRSRPNTIGWLDDDTVTTVYTVTVPTGCAYPSVDDIVQINYTGSFGNSPPIPRFAVFGHANCIEMEVASDEGDYLSCYRRVDGESTTGTTIPVMKPHTLRVSPFDGNTVDGKTYVYSGSVYRISTLVTDSTTEAQQVTQNYYVGAVIYAEPMNVVYSIDGLTINLIDTNKDARAWAVP